MASENVTLVQSLYEAFNRGDIPTVLASMDPSFEWDEPESPGYPPAGLHRGPQEVANNVFGPIPTYYEEFSASAQEFIDTGGDRVIVLGEYKGKGKASGTPFVAPFVHIQTFRNGKWVRFKEYTDTGTIAAAVK